MLTALLITAILAVVITGLVFLSAMQDIKDDYWRDKRPRLRRAKKRKPLRLPQVILRASCSIRRLSPALIMA